MGGPARGALGSQGENARPCRCPPGARRMREEDRGTGENEGGSRRLEEGDPMVEGSAMGSHEGSAVEGEEDPEVKEALSR